MAWNEPDNNDDQNNDAWGKRPGNRRPGNNDQNPPDLDEIINSALKKLSALFGGGGKGRSNNSSSNGGDISGGLIAGIIVIIGLIWAGAGVYTVDEQERGVVLRFGKAQVDVVQPGLHWNPPLIDNVIIVNVTNIYDRSFSNTMLTEDDNIVDITMSVQFVIQDPLKYYLEVKDPEVSLQHAAESAIRHVVGSNIMDDVITTGRSAMAIETRDRLQTYLNNYGTGIYISQVNIDQSQTPAQVREAFDDVIKAREDNQSYQNQARAYASQVVPEARGQARRQIEEANAYREQVIAEAEGEAERFTQLLVEYQRSPEVTRNRIYIDTLQAVLSNSSKVLVDVENGGNNMMVLPLDQIMQQRAAPTLNGGLNASDIRNISNQLLQDLQARPSTTTTRGTR